jgi:YidC/Oxa1 family membrane protein insertase
MWASLVELVRATIFAGAHLLGGSLGASIALVSALVRLALLPLALKNARLARAQAVKLATLRPQLDRLEKRFANEPLRLFQETQALQRANGIQPFTAGSLASTLVQLPLIGALFSAVRNGLGARVRFLWIADLSRADAWLLALVAGVAGVSVAVGPAPAAQGMQRVMVLFAMGATLAFLWSASSAVALSVGAGSAVNLLQSWILAREARRGLPA